MITEANVSETQDVLSPEISRFLRGLKYSTENIFTTIEPGDILRYAGVPNGIIAAEINSVPLEQRLGKALELGVLTDPRGYTWSIAGDRPVVFGKVGGQSIPFFKSSVDGVKNAPEVWYPFFGFNSEGQLIRGDNLQVRNSYGDGALQKMQGILGLTLEWEPGSVFQAHNSEHPGGFCPPAELNTVLYGKDRLLIPPGSDDAEEWIFNILAAARAGDKVTAVYAIIEANRRRLSELGYNVPV